MRIDMRHPRRDQGGFTLVELVVAMSVFLILITMFTAGLVTLTRTTGAIKARAQSAAALGVAGQAFDQELRFANDVNEPGTGASGAVYVEFQTDAADTSDALNHCTQWRYDPAAGTLAMRTWRWSSGTPVPSSWGVKATDVLPAESGDPATYPFERTKANASSPYQQLALVAHAGSSGYHAVSSVRVAYVARNSSVDSVSNHDVAVCTIGGSVPRP
jgi:prepilin-type N-terminal cleavage/methylation domain-containing protein